MSYSLARHRSLAIHFAKSIPMQPRRRLGLLPLLSLSLFASCAEPETWSEDSQVVVVVLIDTLRRDALGCYGHPEANTPRIDELAGEGVRFEQAISSSGWTLPSVASLLTGTWPTVHKAVGRIPRMTPITTDLPVAGEVFQEGGFETLGFVNAAFLSPLLGLDRGFDLFDHRHAYNQDMRRADETVDSALVQVSEREGRDLFVLVHLFDPHLDYDGPEPHRYEFTDGRKNPPAPLTMQTVRALGNSPDPAQAKYVRGLYQGEVAFTDRAVGRLIDGLKELGVWDRTTMVLTADHGEEFWDHGGFEHGHTLYDELIRVPLVVRLPGNEGAGRVVADQVRVLDVMPTLFELTGLDCPESFIGHSLLPLLKGEDDEPRIAFSQSTLYGSDKLSWRTERYHLIFDRAKKAERPMELYDWVADPAEQDDLVHEQPELAKRLYAELRAFHADLEVQGRLLSTPDIENIHPKRIKKYLESIESLGYTGRDE